jgi:hypothetical protein
MASIDDDERILTNADAACLYKKNFGPILSRVIQENYWGKGGSLGITLTAVYDDLADLYTDLGNPVDDQYIGNYYAYGNGDAQNTYTVVLVREATS